MQMQSILLLTNMFPSATAEFYKQHGFLAGGNNITYIQESLIEGFDACEGITCTILNKMLVRPGKWRVPAKKWSHRGHNHEDDLSFSYINLPFFSSNLLFCKAKKHLANVLTTSHPDAVIAYGLTNYTLSAMAYIKKKTPSARTAIIVPDLPRYTKRSGKNPLLRLKNAITNLLTDRKIKKLVKFVDHFFLFAEPMKEELACQKSFSVFEGLATDTFSGITPCSTEEGEKLIVYGGGLHRAYGLDLLMDAFAALNGSEYRLLLCGKGDYVPEIERRSATDPRIRYLGAIPREDLLSYQAAAAVLVNPRTGKDLFSKYSFPSKNMEYLSSGVPMVGFKLGGIPDEYDRYITYPKAETAEALAEAIRAVCTTDAEDARRRALLAKEYVLKEKSKFTQARKMLTAMGIKL